MKTLVQELLIKLSRAGLSTNVLTGISALLAVTLVGCSSDDSSDDGQTKEQVKAQITSALDSDGDGKSDYATTAQLADLNTAVDEVGYGHMTTDEVAAQVTAALADANLSTDALQALVDTANDAADDAWAGSDDAWDAAAEAGDSAADADTSAWAASHGDGSADDETYADKVLAEAQAAQAAAETAQAAAETAQAVAEAAQAAAEAAAAASATTPAAPALEAVVIADKDDVIVNGSSMDNVIHAKVVDLHDVAKGSTFIAGHTYDGVAGNNTLTVTYTGAGDTSANGITTKNIKKLYIDNYKSSDEIELSMAKFEALEELNFSSSLSGEQSVFTGMRTITPIVLEDSRGDFTMTYDSAAVAGTSDEQAITLNKVTEGDVTIAGVEKITIHSTGDKNTLDALAVVNANAMTVTGDQHLTLTVGPNFKTNPDSAAAAIDGTVDASTFSGRLDFSPNVNDVIDFTGGSGNDSLRMANGLDVNDKLDMGDGDLDAIFVSGIITATAFKPSTYVNISNNEMYSLTAYINNDINANWENATEILRFVENATTDKDYTATNLVSGATLELYNGTNAVKMGVVSAGLADSSGTDDILNVKLLGTATHLAADNTVTDLAFSGVETLNLTSGNTATTPLAANDDNTITDISADTALTTLTATGAEPLALTVGVEATELAIVNGSAMTNDLAVTFSVASDVTATTGTGDDLLTFAGFLTNADKVDMGEGDADLLTATIDDATITTGAYEIANAETLQFTATDAAVIDLTKVTGGTTSVEFTGDGNAETMGINGIGGGHKIGLGFNDESGASVTDATYDFALADASGTADSITVWSYECTDATIKATGIEILDLNYSATDTTIQNSAFTFGAAANFSTIKVAGADADVGHTLSFGTLDAETTMVDADEYFGILTATASTGVATTFEVPGDRAHVITGSTANDTVKFLTETTNQAGAIDGGAGTDTIEMLLGDGAQDWDGFLNFENVVLTVENEADVTSNADGDVLELLQDTDVSSVVIKGGNSASSVVFGGTNDALTGSSHTSGVTFDASDFAGDVTFNFAVSQLDDDDVAKPVKVKGTAGTSDTVNALYIGSAPNVKADVSGIEAFNITLGNHGAKVTVDMSEAVGLTSTKFTSTDGGELLMYDNMPENLPVEVVNIRNSDKLEVDLKDDSGSSDKQTVKLTATQTAGDDLLLAGADIEEWTVQNNASNQPDLNLSGVTMTAAGKTWSLIYTGTEDAEIISGSVDLAVIDGSGATASAAIIQSDRDNMDPVQYTGTLGADTFIMKNSSDTISGGAGVDTLSVTYVQNMGHLLVDLSLTDQISQLNGVGNSAVQTGFENLTLTGVTSTASFGANVTGSSAANAITGTGNADTISGGGGDDVLTGAAGADTLIGGGGADTIKGGADADTITGGAGNDDFHVKVNDATDGSDAWTDFGVGADQFQFAQVGASFTNTGGYTLASTTALATEGTSIAVADQEVYIAEVANIANIDTITEVVTALANTGVMDAVDVAANADAYLLLGGADDATKAYLFGVNNDATAAIVAGELALVATVTLVGMTNGVDDLTADNFEFM